MKKTWNRILIIFSIIIVIEAVAGVILLLPHYRFHKIYNDINKGKYESVKNDFVHLREADKEKLMAELDGYASELCTEYIEGKKTYYEVAASFDAIGCLDNTKELTEKYMKDINNYEYMTQIDNVYKAEVKFDSKESFEAKKNVASVMNRLNSEDRDQRLIEMMNSKYISYLEEEISEEEIGKFFPIVSEFALGDAEDYIKIVLNNVASVEAYRKLYSEAVELNKNNKCITVLEICNSVELDPNDTLYKQKFEELYNSAYTCGKLYYSEILNKEVVSGNNETVLKMLDEIVKYYGDDFDYSKYKLAMADKWQERYLDLLKNPDEEIKKNLGTYEESIYKEIISQYDSYKPNGLALYDVDSDGVPELFLKNIDNEDSICFIFTVKEDELCFLGCHNIMNLCDDGYLITRPLYSGNEDSICILNKLDSNTYVQDSMCESKDDQYYVNGSQTNDVDYLKTKSSIMDHSNGKRVSDLKMQPYEDAENCVLSYK